MLKTKEWVEEKPLLIALVSQFFATFAQQGSYIFNLSKGINPDYSNFIEAPPAKKWLKYYHHHKIIINWFSQSLESLTSLSPFVGKLIKEIELLTNDYDFSIWDPNTYHSKPINELHELIIYEFRTEKGREAINLPPKIKKELLQPEFLFVMKIFIPCIFIYAEHPTSLFRKARLGRIDAIDKLLRLDKSIICDSRISEHIYRISLKQDLEPFKHLGNAFQGHLSRKIDRRRVKLIISGLISVISEKFGKRLSSPDIKALFDAIAVDDGIDELIDPDLPDSPEAFSQSVLRWRNFWGPALQTRQ